MEVVEQGTNATAIKSYFFAGQRVAQRVVPSAAWQASPLALGPGDLIEVAAAWIGKPVLIVGLTPAARNAAAAATTILLIALFLMPAGRRRRAVAGMRLGRGRVIGVTLLFGIGSLPLPILVRPAQAQCTGCNCPTPTPVPGSYLRFLHYDHLNSPLMITDGNGTVVEQIRYNPYGSVRARLNGADQAIGAPDPEDVRYEFTGYEAERNSGLLYANARYYDPVVGSFLSHDPAGQFANPYTYTGWDPVNLTDPSGEWVQLAVLGLLIAASVAQSIVNGGDAADAVGAGFFALGTFLLAAGTIGPISPTAPKTWLAVRSLQLASGGYGLAQAFRNEQYIVGATGAALFALGLVAVGSEAPKVVENLFAAPADTPPSFAGMSLSDWEAAHDAEKTPAARMAPPRKPSPAGVVDTNDEAVAHYFEGKGAPVDLGPRSRDSIMNAPEQLRRLERIMSGQTPSSRGHYAVESSMYFINRTPVYYDTTCYGGRCTTTFTSVGDGFWDIVVDGDGIGPGSEVLGGTPYRFNSFRWQAIFSP